MVVEFNHLLPTMPELGMGLPNDYEQDSLNLSGTCCCGQIRGRLREQVQSWTYTDNRQSHFPA